MQENRLLASFPSLFRTGDASVLVGSGPDDCAHVAADGRRLAFSTDMFAENSHFLPGDDPLLVAEKALAASVSDLAASACFPRWALVGLCLKKGAPQGWADAFARGLAGAARKWNVTVIGGDTVASPCGTVVSATVAGEPMPGGPVLRSGGRPGDVLAVTGALGGSILGRHLRPEPRVREMAELMRFAAALPGNALPSACMDISDGLALDLSRLCRESGTGAVVDESLVPVAPAAAELAQSSGRTPLAHALSDGEDFELLVASPPALWQAFRESGQKNFTRIGVLVEQESGLQLRGVDGTLRPLAPEGFEHTW